MRVYVTGGTGAIGGYAVPAMIAAGHDVRALARTDAAASALRAHGATPVRVSLFDRDGLAESFDLMSLARRRVGFRAGRPDAYVSSIHLADAAAAVVSALHVDSGTYNIVDDLPVTKRNHTAALAGAVGRHPVVTGPGRAALLLGERTTSLTRSLRVSNKRFRSAGGWQPRYHSVWEGYAQMARRLGVGSS
nr:NmrA family NAD(P)-binding protein [Gordonia sp. LAM0048]